MNTTQTAAAILNDSTTGITDAGTTYFVVRDGSRAARVHAVDGRWVLRPIGERGCPPIHTGRSAASAVAAWVRAA